MSEPTFNESDIADEAAQAVLGELIANGLIPVSAMLRAVLLAKRRLVTLRGEKGWPVNSEAYVEAVRKRTQVLLDGLMTPPAPEPAPARRDPVSDSYRELFGSIFGIPPRPRGNGPLN